MSCLYKSKEEEKINEYKIAKKKLLKHLKIHSEIEKHNRKGGTQMVDATSLKTKTDLLYTCLLNTRFKKGAKVMVSVSGGATSGYMAHYVKERFSDKYRLSFVYANTGQEHEQTLKFLNSCDLFFNLSLDWIESKQNTKHGVGATYTKTDYLNADREGRVFEDMIKKHGIPNMAFPHCTRELKIAPLTHYRRTKGIELQAIGIRSDEIKRAITSSLLSFYEGDIDLAIIHRKEIDGVWYPLISDNNATKNDIITWWGRMPFKLNLEGEHYGNCVGCFKKTKRKLLTLAKNNAKQLKFLEEMENKYSDFIPPTQAKGRREKSYFFRNHQPVADLMEEAKTSTFVEYRDILRPTLFANDKQMDEEFSCDECGTIF